MLETSRNKEFQVTGDISSGVKHLSKSSMDTEQSGLRDGLEAKPRALNDWKQI